jgi:hypothetical protein
MEYEISVQEEGLDGSFKFCNHNSRVYMHLNHIITKKDDIETPVMETKIYMWGKPKRSMQKSRSEAECMVFLKVTE